MPLSILIIGVGNLYRRDDGLGPAAARALAGRLPPGAVVRVASGEATALMRAWEGAEVVILIDATAARGAPGTITRLDASATPVPAELLARSTHDAGVGAAIELARALGQLPARVIVYGVEGQDFADGEGLSRLVAPAVRAVVRRVVAEVRAQRESPRR